MMNVKLGTTTWNKSGGGESLHTDQAQTLSATDRDKALGSEDVGAVLNKIADPNWVEPSKMRKAGGNQLDKDAFMKLMLTQMKYQDPSSPMQSHEMAAQLAQFTSLEQLSNINTTLAGMKQQQTPQINYQALNFIGKKVSGDSSKLTRVAGDKEHEFHFNISNDAMKAKIAITDTEGNVVKKMDLANLKKGENSVKWNGLADDGMEARPGDYIFSVEASASNGSRVFSKTDFEGKITGLNYTPTGPVLLVGQQAIRMADVKRIEEASPEGAAAQQAPNIQQAVDAKDLIGKAQDGALKNLVNATAPKQAQQGQEERVKAPSVPETKTLPPSQKAASTTSGSQGSINKSVGMSSQAMQKYNDAKAKASRDAEEKNDKGEKS
jgi:flagellar basal-body rod modification protein FlgD